MSFDNLSFETESAIVAGYPDAWAIGTADTGEEAAGYDDGSAANVPARPSESFEGAWSSNESFTFAFADPPDLAEVDFAIYDGALPDLESFEDFEEGWDANQTYLTGWGSSASASYDTTTPEAVEDFEEEWDSNGSYATTFSGTAADYDTGTGGASEAVEDFEEALAEFAVVADPGTDTLTATGHGLSNGQKVTFRNAGGALPAGLAPTFVYYVIGATANTFQVSATSGGSAVDLTDAGQGTHYAIPDPEVFWVQTVNL